LGRPERLWVFAAFGMEFDASTLFVVVMASTFANALLVAWVWLRNSEERSLLFMALGFTLAGVGNVLLAGRDTLPTVASIDLANSLIVYGVAMIWVTARVFNRRPVPWLVPLAGVAVWLGLVQLPPVGDSYAARVIVASAVTTFYCLIGAREFWLQDGLRARLPVIVVLLVHSVVVLARIPIAIIDADNLSTDFTSPWFAPMALETLVFIQALALLVVSLIKERAEAKLRTAAMTDPLTGLANRRAFFNEGKRLIASAERAGQSTALIAFDLDRFKRINDTYGHPFGDAVLEAFALAAREGLRAGDLAGRIGGEEFAAVLPGADAQEARAAATRVMEIFASLVGVEEEDRTWFTASAGLAVSEASAVSIEALFISADRALYEAKHSGGNRLRAAAPLPA